MRAGYLKNGLNNMRSNTYSAKSENLFRAAIKAQPGALGESGHATAIAPPKSVINVIAGVSEMRWKDYAVGTFIVVRRLRISAPKTKSDWDDIAGHLLARIHGLFLFVLALYAGSLVLPLPEDVSGLFGKLFGGAFLFQAALIGNRLITWSSADAIPFRTWINPGKSSGTRSEKRSRPGFIRGVPKIYSLRDGASDGSYDRHAFSDIAKLRRICLQRVFADGAGVIVAVCGCRHATGG